MILIEANHERRVAIPGVPSPVSRPVDIDQSTTGFTALRTLRIYRFENRSVIEGHAEEDEVFIVVLAGAIEFTMIVNPAEQPVAATLSAPGKDGVACAAYLPPRAAYKLVTLSDADVAYARATPAGTRPPRVFDSSGPEEISGIRTALEEVSYAERLRIRLLSFDADQNHDRACAPFREDEAGCEKLMQLWTRSHAKAVVSITGSDLSAATLGPHDTAAAMPGEDAVLNIAPGSSGLVLIVMAS